MGTDFQPQTAFEGYVAAKLDGIEKRLDGLPCDKEAQALSDLERKVSNIEGKASMLGGVFGTVATFIIKFLFKP